MNTARLAGTPTGGDRHRHAHGSTVRGFTLTELVVTVAVVGGIAVSSLTGLACGQPDGR